MDDPTTLKPRNFVVVALGPSDAAFDTAMMRIRDAEPLLARFDEYLKTNNGKDFDAGDRELLKSIICEANVSYHYDKIHDKFYHGIPGPNLHEIVASVVEVIKVLKQPSNLHDILVALGAPTFEKRRIGTIGPDGIVIFDDTPEDRKANNQANARYVDLLRSLDAIAAAAPPKPPANRRGAPGRKDLYLTVLALANWWMEETGMLFTQYWDMGEPLNRAMRFVHAAMWIIDPETLSALPNMTETLVAEHGAEWRQKIGSSAK
jgi:hypothetical protein